MGKRPELIGKSKKKRHQVWKEGTSKIKWKGKKKQAATTDLRFRGNGGNCQKKKKETKKKEKDQKTRKGRVSPPATPKEKGSRKKTKKRPGKVSEKKVSQPIRNCFSKIQTKKTRRGRGFQRRKHAAKNKGGGGGRS